jgi:uncharacterized protein YcbX
MTSVHIPGLRIAALWTYPVKSCAGVSLSQATLTDKGLDHDRAWMVVDAEGEMLTQRELPRMALIQPQLHASTADGCALTFQAPGMPPMTVEPSDHATTASRVRVWDDEVPAFDAGEAVSRWLTQFLLAQAKPGILAPLRLVRFDDRHARPSSAKWTQGHTALNRFSDGFALLVVSQASLDALNHRLAQQSQPAVDIRRFRPNIVIDGDKWQAHDEDRVQRVSVQTDKGEAVLLPVKPCPRCPIPDIDPDTAQAGAVISPLLQTYRQDARVNGAITFGMNALVLQGVGHTLQVGQRVEAPWDF